jgi:hypothetical protein
MSTPQALEPATFYYAEAVCHTVGCPNQDIIMKVPAMYSNDGSTYAVFCGLCSSKAEVVTATKLDPQPVME